MIPVTIEKCRVTKGKWNDFYFNEILVNPAKIDIDHIVPIKHAHDNGGANWKKKDKLRFYTDEENLVITNRSYNRQKGDKDFTKWHPVNRDYACKYAKKWLYIKKKYRLEISKSEEKDLAILNCSDL